MDCRAGPYVDRWWALGAWAVLVVIVFTLGGAFGGKLNDSFSLPDTESLKAQELLEQMKGGQASRGDDRHRQHPVVARRRRSSGGRRAATASTISPMLTSISKLPGVACVTDPFSQTGVALGAGCPKPQAPPDLSQVPPAQQAAFKAALLAASAKAVSPISPDGHVAKSVVTFSGGGDGTDVPTATAKSILDAVKAANGTDGHHRRRQRSGALLRRPGAPER